MQLNLFVSVFLLISLSGCQRMLLGIYGVDAKPRAKTNEEIRSYIAGHDMTRDKQYTIDNYGLEIIYRKAGSFSAFLLFDTDGYLLMDSSANACLENKIDKVEYMLRNRYFKKDTSLNLFDLKKHIVSNIQTGKNDFLEERHTYYLVLTWATYAGRFNKKNYTSWYREVSKYREKYDISLINISVDFLKNMKYDNLNYKPE